MLLFVAGMITGGMVVIVGLVCMIKYGEPIGPKF